MDISQLLEIFAPFSLPSEPQWLGFHAHYEEPTFLSMEAAGGLARVEPGATGMSDPTMEGGLLMSGATTLPALSAWPTN